MGTRSTDDPFYQGLGKALKKARVESSTTPTQAAHSIGHTHSNAILRYENATRTPDVKTLAALSTTYGVETSSLIDQAWSAAAQVNQLKKDSKNG